MTLPISPWTFSLRKLKISVMMLVLRMPLLVPVLVNKILFLNAPCPIFNHLKVGTLRISLDNFQANLVPWIQFHPGLSKGILISCFPQSLRSLMILFPPALSLLLLKSPSLHLWLRRVTLTETRLRTIGLGPTCHFFPKSLRRQRHVK